MRRLRAIGHLIRRHPLLANVFVLAGVLALAGVVVIAGIVPITASSGHWAVTSWFLHFAMRRSVVTHARLVVEPPPGMLDDETLVIRGASHYETGCRRCHGAPGDLLPRVPRAMTPHPPELTSRLPDWNARELFYIVRHGVKFTGMPAWPAPGRDDEVWAVVAFLRRMPALGARDYRALVHGSRTGAAADDGDPRPAAMADAPAVVIEHCARCHGMDGSGRDAAFPKIAGQRHEYLRRAMAGYAAGSRHSGIMEPVAAHLSEADAETAVRYYASLPAPTAVPGQISTRVERGSLLIHQGEPRRSLPSCGDCHLPGGARVNDAYPLLAGQYPWYVVQQLRLLQSRARGGSEYVHLMHEFVDVLTPAQIQDVAAYFASAQGR